MGQIQFVAVRPHVDVIGHCYMRRACELQGLEVAVLQEVSQSVGIPVVGLGGLASLEEIRTLHPSTNLNGYAAGSLFIYQGKHRGVLVNYPSSEEVKKLFS